MSEWQTIETMPNLLPASFSSGAHMLLFAKARPWAIEVGYYESKIGRFKGWRGEVLTRDFTHWMPLPKPPAGNE